MTSSSVIYLPGQEIETGLQSVMPGHGTLLLPNGHVTSLCAGPFVRIGSVVSVQCLKQRYKAQQADVVVGRVIELSIEKSEWSVDIGTTLKAKLPLSSIMEQRRQTQKDALNMRSFFTEGDLICGVIYRANPNSNSVVHLSDKLPQKLEYGTLINVPSTLIKRVAEHYRHFDFGIDCILSHNGNIWISPSASLRQQYATTHPEEIFSRVARLRNVILSFSTLFKVITPETLEKAYHMSETLGMKPYDILANETAMNRVVASGLKDEKEDADNQQLLDEEPQLEPENDD
nr:exosome complex component RRP4 [Paratrimastix eleionoma]